MLEFMNLFMIPFISMNIIYRREKKDKSLDGGFVIMYALCVITVYIVTFFIMMVLTLALGMGGNSTSHFYTFVSIVVSFIIPYLFEICRKYLKISFEVEENRK